MPLLLIDSLCIYDLDLRYHSRRYIECNSGVAMPVIGEVAGVVVAVSARYIPIGNSRSAYNQ